MQCRYVFGLLSPRCTGNARATWNALLVEKGIDGFFDFYAVRTALELELRLAEMFHLGRTAYILSPAQQTQIRPLLDAVDAEVGDKPIDTVINQGGVLVGYALSHLPPDQQLTEWLTKGEA